MQISLSTLLNSKLDDSGEVTDCLVYAMRYGEPKFLKATPLRESAYQFDIGDVKYVAAARIEEGSWNETSLIAVVRLLNGDWAAFEAGCDTTGWDCQSYCDIRIGSDLSDVINYGLGNEARLVLAQLILKKPNRLLKINDSEHF